MRSLLRRSLLLPAAGAVLGLLLAGIGLFTARGTTTLTVPAEDVAMVNQQPISRQDFVGLLQSLYGVTLVQSSPAQRARVLHDMLREELFVQRAKELDLAATDPELRTAMVNAVEQEVAADAITQVTPEDTLHAYYASHQSRYSSEGAVTLQDTVYPDQAAAAARQGGHDSGRVHGEEFYFAAEIHLGSPLFAAARALRDGESSAPLVQPDGVHVITMLHNVLPVAQDYATARDRVQTDYRNEAVAGLKAADEAFFFKRATILLADDVR